MALAEPVGPISNEERGGQGGRARGRDVPAPPGAWARVRWSPRAWVVPLVSARARILLALIFVAFVRQLILVVATPPYQGHDEVAHVGYLWTIIEYKRLPTLDDNLPVALSAWVYYTLDWPALYTANHPPLYYLLARPLYEWLGPPQTPDEFVAMLYTLRLLAIPFYLATIGLAYALARTIFPRDDFLALTVPAAIAFGPQLAYEGAIFNNDILSIFSGALILFLLATVLRRGLTPIRALAIGVALGLGLLGKATITIFFPLVAPIALWSCWPRPWGQVRTWAWWRATMVRAAALIAPAVLLPAPWYLFLRRTYGDFSAFQAIQALQSSWNVPEGTFSQLLHSRTFHLERIHEYWGYFGWKYIPLGSGELRAVHAGLLLCGAGLVVGLVRTFRTEWMAAGAERAPEDRAERGIQVAGVALVLAANLLMYGAMIYFGTMFQLTQARYIFPVATATALLAMLGLRALLPARLLRPAAALTIGALGVFNVLVLTRLVIPYAFL